MGKSTVICRVRPRGWATRPRRIDVWWGGLQSNGDMLLLFAYLMSVNPEWRGVEIVIHSIADDEEMRANTQREVLALLQRQPHPGTGGGGSPDGRRGARRGHPPEVQ